MKKKIRFLIPILIIAALCLAAWFCGYPCKNPSKEQMEDLGEPNGCLLGKWGDIRETDSANSLIVYCDPNGVVKHIIVRSKKIRSSVLTNQTLCKSSFLGIQINPPYALIPYGGFTVL